MDRFDDAAFEAANDEARADSSSNINVVFCEVTSSSGPLSKRISLGQDGKLVATSTRPMNEGTLRRIRLTGTPAQVAEAYGRYITGMRPNSAVIIGDLHGVDAEVDVVDVVRKAVLEERRKTAKRPVIARTLDYLRCSTSTGFWLLDHDRKDMPQRVADKLAANGEFLGVLNKIIVGFDQTPRVERPSTSSGIYRTDDGTVFPGSGGRHVYGVVLDQSDIERASDVLHKLFWLHDYGWLAISKAGELLERSPSAVAVASPERLAYEGAPILAPPLAQNAADRAAIVHPGTMVLDTRRALPDLTPEEEARYRELVAAAKAEMAPEANARREEYVKARGAELGEGGEDAVRLAVEHRVLTGDFPILFDDGSVATADEILENRDVYHGKTLPDPLEGPDYGLTKAQLYANKDGSVIINSFAHGGRVFRLVHSSEEEVRDRQVEEDFAEFLPGGEFFKGNAAGGQSAPGSDDAQKAKSWRSKLLLTQKGERRICEHNIGLVLENDPALVGCLALNLMGQRIIARNLPWHDGCDAGEWQPWGDADDVELARYLQSKHGIFAGPKIVSGAIIAHAKRNAVHPLRDILNGLAWDGVRRLDTWTSTYLGAEDTPYTRAVGKRWTIAAVARVMEPGCKADCALILEGAQGARKSTAAGVLAIKPEWFADELAALGSKDAAQDMVGKWIIELAELSAIRTNAAVENVKAFVSRRVDRYRPSYGRYSQDFPRQCVFIGTTNADTYLVDETGNRRYWPVRVGEIKIEDLRRDVLPLWAEAVVAYRAGERWYLTHDEERTLAQPEQGKRRENDVWEKCISDHLAKSSGPVTVEGILTDAVKMPVERQEARHQTRVGRVLKALGYERRQRRVNGKQTWFYFPPGYDDTAATESQNGATAEADNIVRLPVPQAPHAGSRTSVEKDLAAYLTDTSVADELSALM